MDRDDWDYYTCTVNDNLSFVLTNLGLVDAAPVRQLPVLHWLWIRLQFPDDRGLSTDREFDRLCKYEDELKFVLSGRDDIIFVGRITGAGRREFYFYSSENVDFKQAIDTVLANNRDYPFQAGSKPDAEWSQYLGLLYPGEDGLAQIRGRRAK